MITRMEFAKLAEDLGVLWSKQDHDPLWEDGFLAALKVFDAVLGLSEGRVVPFTEYAGLTGEGHVLRITNAAQEADGLGVEHLSLLGTCTRTGQVFRRVQVPRELREWQEARWASGGSLVFDVPGWDALLQENWFSQTFESAQVKKKKRDFMANFKGKEKSREKRLENQRLRGT